LKIPSHSAHTSNKVPVEDVEPLLSETTTESQQRPIKNKTIVAKIIDRFYAPLILNAIAKPIIVPFTHKYSSLHFHFFLLISFISFSIF
jgi:hypothetical protein